MSTPSERAFSIAGSVVNMKWACLLPENVSLLPENMSMLVFHIKTYLSSVCNELY